MKARRVIRFSIAALLAVGITSCRESPKMELAETGQAQKEQARTTPENALEHYLGNGDKTFAWEVKDSFDLGGVKAYDLLLTSQKWREFTWKHQLTIFVPSQVDYDGALLFITGGKVEDGMPKWRPRDNPGGESKGVAMIAQKNRAITAIVRQVPMQPLYDGDLVEDELISFTLHNFKNDKDYSWPLLFPMVKSAVRAMDAVQEFAQKNLGDQISRFTVTGASKRGWTTWLTGASDPRVEAIAPMVIDVLNMPVNLQYQIEVWNQYSPQINDYVKLEIPQTVNTPDGNALSEMIDPYSYRKKLTMPKLILNGTNDPYWPVDAIKNYLDSIPGKNYLHYTPNAGHNLNGGEKALATISGFWEHTLKKEPYEDIEYRLDPSAHSASLWVKSVSSDVETAYLWYADSEDRDFRDEEFKSIKIKAMPDQEIKQQIDFPKKGFKAFYMDLQYKDPNGGSYTKSTRMYVADDDEVL